MTGSQAFQLYDMPGIRKELSKMVPFAQQLPLPEMQAARGDQVL
jgi:hypothetical protein